MCICRQTRHQKCSMLAGLIALVMFCVLGISQSIHPLSFSTVLPYKTRVLRSVSRDTKVWLWTSQAKIPTASMVLVCSHKCPKSQATCLGVLKIEVDLCAWMELDGSLSPVKGNNCTGLLLPSCLCALDAMRNSALGFWTGTPYMTLIVSALISLLYFLHLDIK